MRPKHRLEIAGLRLVIRICDRLSLERALAVGAGIGRFAWSVVRIRRRVAEENLRATLGRDWTGREIRDTLCRTYENMGRSLTEFCCGARIDLEHVNRYVTFEGLEHLDRALARGKGVVMVSGHYGAWQYLGGALALRGYEVNYVALEQRNPEVDRLQSGIAADHGVRFIYPGAGIRGVLAALRRGEIVAILADQHASGAAAVISFLGRPAAAARGPALFALRTGAALIPAYMIREHGLHHRLVLRPEIDAAPRGTEEEDVAAITRAHAAVLEEFIRMHPDHWLWMHRRWKIAPDTPLSPAAPTAAATGTR